MTLYFFKVPTLTHILSLIIRSPADNKPLICFISSMLLKSIVTVCLWYKEGYPCYFIVVELLEMTSIRLILLLLIYYRCLQKLMITHSHANTVRILDSKIMTMKFYYGQTHFLNIYRYKYIIFKSNCCVQIVTIRLCNFPFFFSQCLVIFRMYDFLSTFYPFSI